MSAAKLSKSVLRGIKLIDLEMGCYADCKDDEGKDARKEAADIRAALVWLREAVVAAKAAA